VREFVAGASYRLTEDDLARRPGIIPVRVKDHPSESLVRVRIPLACGGGVIISALWRCLTEEDLAGALVVQLAPCCGTCQIRRREGPN
jgi:hypothetical protein